jgi:hypothetical protein
MVLSSRKRACKNNRVYGRLEKLLFRPISSSQRKEKRLLMAKKTWVGLHPKAVLSPNSSLRSEFYPWNIKYMPAAKFFARLDLEKNPSFRDGNQVNNDCIDEDTNILNFLQIEKES